MFAVDRVSLSLHPSWRLALVLGIGHGVAAGVPWALALPWWVALPMSAAILALGGHSIARDALRLLQSSIVRIDLDADGSGTIGTRSGRSESIRIASGATVVSIAVVASVTTATGHRRGVVVVPGACAGHEFRRLKVFLRWRLRMESGLAGADQASRDKI